jgi:hypothetical protein
VLGLKHPIIKVSLFSGKTFKFEFHPVIVKFSKTDEFIDVYWIAMNKFYRFTKRVINTKI